MKNITHFLHSERLTIVSALFLWTAPYKHTQSLSWRYLKSHCAHEDKPQQPECHKASDKVQSPKFATVEIEIILKNTQMESTVLVSLF